MTDRCSCRRSSGMSGRLTRGSRREFPTRAPPGPSPSTRGRWRLSRPARDSPSPWRCVASAALGSGRGPLRTRPSHSYPVPRAHLASSSAAQLHDVRRGPRELPAAAQADRGKHPVSPPAPCSALNQHAASALTRTVRRRYTNDLDVHMVHPLPSRGRGRTSDRAKQWGEVAVHVAPRARRRRRRSLCPSLGPSVPPARKAARALSVPPWVLEFHPRTRPRAGPVRDRCSLLSRR